MTDDECRMLNKNVEECHRGLETLAFHLIQPDALKRVILR